MSMTCHTDSAVKLIFAAEPGFPVFICDRLWENRAQRGMRRRRKKIDLVLKIVLNKPNEGNG